MYLAFKHSHSLIAFIVIALFLFRFVLKLMQSPLLQNKAIRIAPHIFDTALLTLGITLMITTGSYFEIWLIVKIILIVVYIVSAFFCLKKAQDLKQTLMYGSISLFSLLMILKLAYTKSLPFM